MKIRIKLLGQARTVARSDAEEIECGDDATLDGVLAQLAAKHGEALHRILLDDRGKPHPSVMLFINDEQIYPGSPIGLHDADELTIMPPISGG